MTTAFRASNGKTYAVSDMGNCELHGLFPNVVQEVLQDGKLGFYSRNLGCPICNRLENEKKTYGAISIPPRFFGKNFSNFVPSENSKKVYGFFLDYANNLPARIKAGTSAILTGNPGTGKTHLACALLFEAKKQGFSSFFINIRKLFRCVRDSWREGAAESESQVIERFVAIDLLVIDEVGVQANSENERNILYDILNGRYEATKPTILLSNEPLESIENIIGARSFDRLREGGGRAFDCKWESFRRKAELAQSEQVQEKNDFKFFELNSGDSMK